MNDVTRKLKNQASRQKRTRARMTGTSDRPRLSVKISTTNVSAQIINDESGKTIASATSIGAKLNGTLTEKSTAIGELIAKDAVKKKIKKVVFDRGAKMYHGRIKALAEAARKNGLEF